MNLQLPPSFWSFLSGLFSEALELRKDFIQEKIRLHKEEEAIGVGRLWPQIVATYTVAPRKQQSYIVILTIVFPCFSLHVCKHCFINHIYEIIKIYCKHQRCQPKLLLDRGRKRPSSSNCMRQGPREGFCWIAGCDFMIHPVFGTESCKQIFLRKTNFDIFIWSSVTTQFHNIVPFHSRLLAD